MKRIFFFAAFAAVFPGGLFAEDGFKSFLQTIKGNNPSLQAAANNAAAQTAQARTGINPVDPSIDYGYFPGNRQETGTKTTLNASLSIPFPATYINKRAVSRLTGTRVNEEYRSVEQDVLVSAAQLYMQVVCLNKLCAELKKRTEEVEATRLLIERKTQAGDANLPELQKARMEAVLIQNEYAIRIAEKTQCAARLKAMNGDRAIDIADTSYPVVRLPAADSIMAFALTTDPGIKALEAELNVAKKTVRLQKSLWLPQVKVGYGEENILNDTYRGVQAGISVPLWQNAHTVKQAVFREQAVEKEFAARKINIKAALESEIISVNALKANIGRFSSTIEAARNDALLRTSLETGNISIIDYFQERRYRFEVYDRYLKEECEYYTVLIHLAKYFW